MPTHELAPGTTCVTRAWRQATVALGSALLLATAWAQAEPAPPFDLADPARIKAGKMRFGSNCAAYCHGREGEGGKTPPFKGRQDLSAQVVFQTISKGRVGTDVMPPWGSAFSPEEIWELVAYIQDLGRQPRP